MTPSPTRRGGLARVPRRLTVQALGTGPWRTRRSAAGLLTALALAGGALGAADANASSTSCSFTASNGVATLQIGGGGVTELELNGQTLKWFDALGLSGSCVGPGGQV